MTGHALSDPRLSLDELVVDFVKDPDDPES